MRPTTSSLLLPLLLLVASACAAPVRHELTPDDLVTQLQTADAAQREGIARDAWRAGPAALPALAEPLASDDPALRKNAMLAVETIAHHACAPGAPSERARAGGGLVALLEAPLDTQVRAEIARLLGAVADDRASVRTLSDKLADPQLAESALFALERCQHTDAGTVLVEALGRGDLAVTRVAVVNALGARRERAASGELVALTARGQPEEARAARAALSRIGDVRAEQDLLEAVADGKPGATADLLRYAEARLAAGQPEDTLRLISDLRGSGQAYERAAAVRLAARAGGEDELDALIVALGDPSPQVRAVARAELVASTSVQTTGALEHAMDDVANTSASSRAEILRVIVARGDRGAVERMQAAAVDTSPQLRLAALELAAELVEPSLEEAVVRGARSIDVNERAAARRSLLAYADAHRVAKEEERALELYHALLAGGDEDEATRAALSGVTALADPVSLEHLRPLVGRPDLVDDVDRARVAVAAALATDDRESAVAELDSVCTGAASRSIRAEAAEQLRELGIDTSAYARGRGFMTTWYLSGPFPRDDDHAIGTHPFGEGGPTPPEGEPAEVAGGANLPPWRRVESEDLDGALDLTTLFDPHDNVSAYALAPIQSDVETDALLKIGSDDGVAVWLNGERLHVNDVARGLSVDADEVPMRLRAGTNALLVQVTQGGGGWGLCVRLCDAGGEPIDLSR